MDHRKKNAQLFPPLAHPAHLDEAIMAFAPVGNGYVGYIGDLHLQAGLIPSNVVMAGMLRIMDHLNPSKDTLIDTAHDSGNAEEDEDSEREAR